MEKTTTTFWLMVKNLYDQRISDSAKKYVKIVMKITFFQEWKKTITFWLMVETFMINVSVTPLKIIIKLEKTLTSQEDDHTTGGLLEYS